MAFIDDVKAAPRTVAFVVFFLGQTAIITFSQILFSVLRLFSNTLFQRFVDYTQRLFGLLCVATTELFAPSSFIITTDTDAADILDTNSKASLPALSFPDRIILIANHQIYSDWIYIWCIAYFAKVPDAIKIILKDALKHVPIIGCLNCIFLTKSIFSIFKGTRFFDFIFLKRNWATDRAPLIQHLSRLAKSNNPLWLLLFPEGTVTSDHARKKCAAFAEKEKTYNPKNVLLPRSTGMYTCCSQLRKSVNYVYDLTIGYEGLKQEHIPQFEYSLKNMYFLSKYPRQIHVHIRRFEMNQVPADEGEFTHWIRARWQEKDQLMEHFYTHGRFPPSDHKKTIDIKMDHFLDLGHFWLLSIPLITVAFATWYFIRNILF